jgi:two-component system sensor histidine kinase DegS
MERNIEDLSPDNYPLSRVQLFQRQEEEKARTARDLEDTIAQPIANAIFELAAVKSLIATESNLELITEGVNALQEELEQSLTDLRLLIADLEPNTILGNFGLVAGLRRYLEKFKEQTGLKTALQVKTLVEPLPNIIEIAIFRVIQEALQNIRQHANANRVEVVILEENGNLQFSVFDNGAGLAPNLAAHSQRQMGLVSMKEIADLLAGSLELKTETGKGTQITLTIPYPKL